MSASARPPNRWPHDAPIRAFGSDQRCTHAVVMTEVPAEIMRLYQPGELLVHGSNGVDRFMCSPQGLASGSFRSRFTDTDGDRDPLSALGPEVSRHNETSPSNTGPSPESRSDLASSQRGPLGSETCSGPSLDIGAHYHHCQPGMSAHRHDSAVRGMCVRFTKDEERSQRCSRRRTAHSLRVVTFAAA